MSAGVVLIVIVMTRGTFVAAGADASGYVSQSELWATGSLQVGLPLAAELGWPEPEWSLSPLGYRPATVRGYMVPTYPPGLPILMSLAWRVAGPGAVYVVVPLLGLLVLWATHGLALAMGGPRAAAVATACVLCSPTFLHQVVQPLTDVPAAALWSTALLLGWRARTTGQTLCAGLVAALAVAVRPNLVPLAVPIALVTSAGRSTRREALARLFAFCAGLVPGIVLVGLVQHHLYGSPLTSGYGSLDALFSLGNVRPNLQNYASWFITAEPVLLAGGLAGLVLVAGSRRRFCSVRGSLALGGLLLLLVNVGLYLAYVPFGEWWYLRFILPAFPVLAAAFGALVATATSRWRGVRATLLVTLCLGAVCAFGVRQSRSFDAFGPKRVTARFLRAARYVTRRLPAEAVIVCREHSGSLRYYTGRTILRYDYLQPEGLDDAIRRLRALKRPAYFVLDEEEVAAVRQRFAGHSAAGRLDTSLEYVVPGADRVYVFSTGPASVAVSH